jgi:hypothetical protein
LLLLLPTLFSSIVANLRVSSPSNTSMILVHI